MEETAKYTIITGSFLNRLISRFGLVPLDCNQVVCGNKADLTPIPLMISVSGETYVQPNLDWKRYQDDLIVIRSMPQSEVDPISYAIFENIPNQDDPVEMIRHIDPCFNIKSVKTYFWNKPFSGKIYLAIQYIMDEIGHQGNPVT